MERQNPLARAHRHAGELCAIDHAGSANPESALTQTEKAFEASNPTMKALVSSTGPLAIADRTARRRAEKALSELSAEAALLFSNLKAGREIDADSAGRQLGSYVAEAAANLGQVEAYRLVRESAPEGGNGDVVS